MSPQQQNFYFSLSNSNDILSGAGAGGTTATALAGDDEPWSARLSSTVSMSGLVQYPSSDFSYPASSASTKPLSELERDLLNQGIAPVYEPQLPAPPEIKLNLSDKRSFLTLYVAVCYPSASLCHH